jgi:riboflavin biosynthesis pyrimidine reductase
VIRDSDFSSADGIADFYRVSADLHLRVNMVVSLDGNFAGPSGSSRDLSGPLDLKALLTLRLLSDVVLVGAKTALGEKYRYTQVRDDLRSVAPHNPPFCLISSTLQIPSEAPILSDSVHKPIIITCASGDAQWSENFNRLTPLADIHVLNTPALDGVKIRETLHSLGFKKIICEGGPKLLNTLLASQVVDELDLTISPTIVGSEPSAGALGHTFERLQLIAAVSAQDFIFSRYQFRESAFEMDLR